MSQEEFIRDFLSTWEMSSCRSLSTPGEPVPLELPKEEDTKPDDVIRAQKMAGSLIWLSTRTRPDSSYAQTRISSVATKAPKRVAVEGFRLLRYLQGTKTIGLHFRKCINHDEVIAYADANFAIERSQSGSVVQLGLSSIAWRSS